MDKQRCPLRIGSFGYTDQDVSYNWTTGRGVNIASDMKLSQFDLIATPTGNETTERSKGTYSTLLVSFHLQRHMGDFVIQVYGPCILLVVISWVSFWLNREATSDRISLGITTVLTMTFMGLEARKDLPKVTYPTALDYFVFISFMYIFCTVVQFGLVHHFTKMGSGEYYLEELENEICRKNDLDKSEKKRYRKSSFSLTKTMSLPPNESASENCLPVISSDNNLYEYNCTINQSAFSLINQHVFVRTNSSRNGVFNGDEKFSSVEDFSVCRCKRCITRAMNDPDETLNSVSKIDRITRVVFPLSYITINIVYWNYYLGTQETVDTTVESYQM